MRRPSRSTLRRAIGAIVLACAPVMASAAAHAAEPAIIVAPLPASPVAADAAIARDAAEYARTHAVSVEAAVRRLRAQEASVAATDAIAARYRQRLAGLWIEHRPVYRIVILLTGVQAPPDEAVLAGGMIVPIVYRAGAPASRDRIVAAVGAHQAAIRAALPIVRGIAADPRTGDLVAMIRAEDADRVDPVAAVAQIAMIAGVPAHLRLLGARDANLSLDGGARLEGVATEEPDRHAFICTAGFVVTDGVRDGIATAAHCPDELSGVEADGARTPLRFVGQWGARYQDVQINVADATLQPVFHAEDRGAGRRLTGWRNRGSTRAGDFVCHRGERSGYSCAEVEYVDYAPPPPLCAGQCDALWIAVAGPSCRPGDSGGPVFMGTTAFGLLKGGSYAASGSCDLYYYMSTDFLPPGWSLRHDRPVADRAGAGADVPTWPSAARPGATSSEGR